MEFCCFCHLEEMSLRHSIHKPRRSANGPFFSHPESVSHFFFCVVDTHPVLRGAFLRASLTAL